VRASELSVLDQIVARKRAELLLDQARTPVEQLEKRVKFDRRGFRRSLERQAPAIIAEIKRASPSRGVIAGPLQPADVARRYEAGGAAALSVLTDIQFFRGSLEDLEQARQATRLPVLRKDFTLDRYHVWQAAAYGADAILLIVAILPRAELVTLLDQARDLDLDALVEVHDRAELERALEAGADLIGVNNRNLQTFEVSLETSLQLAGHIPPHVLAVSESGIRSAADILRLAEAGYRAFLIGESLMSQPDPGKALEAIVAGVNRAARNN
jgi:indole-3-glycerol phosphate synthase